MAYSWVTYEYTGSTKIFSVPFPFLKREDIHVYFDGLEQDKESFEWLDDKSIKLLATDIPVGTKVRIRRLTEKRFALVDFKNGSVLDEKDLDLNTYQLLFIAQEAYDALEASPHIDDSNQWDMLGLPVHNVGAPKEPTDAATKEYVDAIIPDLKTEADRACKCADDATDAALESTAQAGRAKFEADRAESEADRAWSAAEYAEGYSFEASVVSDKDYSSGETIFLPDGISYTVGAHVLEIFVRGTRWAAGVEYEEVGTEGQTSERVKLLTDVKGGDGILVRAVSTRVMKGGDLSEYLKLSGGTMSGAVDFPHGQISSDSGANTRGLNVFGGSDGYGTDAGFMARSGGAGTQSGVFKAATKRGTDGHVTELEGTPTEGGKPATISWGGKPVAHRGGVFVPRSVTNCVTSAPKGVARHDGTVILLHQDVELLVADGVNADNTLRTIPYTITRDYTFDVAGMEDGEYIGGYSIKLDGIAVILKKDYFIQETQPTGTSGALQLWFDTNRSRYYYSAQGGTGWEQEPSQISCALFRYTLKGGKISDWHATWPCRLVKAEDVLDATAKINDKLDGKVGVDLKNLTAEGNNHIAQQCELDWDSSVQSGPHPWDYEMKAPFSGLVRIRINTNRPSKVAIRDKTKNLTLIGISFSNERGVGANFFSAFVQKGHTYSFENTALTGGDVLPVWVPYKGAL